MSPRQLFVSATPFIAAFVFNTALVSVAAAHSGGFADGSSDAKETGKKTDRPAGKKGSSDTGFPVGPAGVEDGGKPSVEKPSKGGRADRDWGSHAKGEWYRNTTPAPAQQDPVKPIVPGAVDTEWARTANPVKPRPYRPYVDGGTSYMVAGPGDEGKNPDKPVDEPRETGGTSPVQEPGTQPPIHAPGRGQWARTSLQDRGLWARVSSKPVDEPREVIKPRETINPDKSKSGRAVPIRFSKSSLGQGPGLLSQNANGDGGLAATTKPKPEDIQLQFGDNKVPGVFVIGLADRLRAARDKAAQQQVGKILNQSFAQASSIPGFYGVDPGFSSDKRGGDYGAREALAPAGVDSVAMLNSNGKKGDKSSKPSRPYVPKPSPVYDDGDGDGVQPDGSIVIHTPNGIPIPLDLGHTDVTRTALDWTRVRGSNGEISETNGISSFENLSAAPSGNILNTATPYVVIGGVAFASYATYKVGPRVIALMTEAAAAAAARGLSLVTRAGVIAGEVWAAKKYMGPVGFVVAALTGIGNAGAADDMLVPYWQDPNHLPELISKSDKDLLDLVSRNQDALALLMRGNLLISQQQK